MLLYFLTAGVPLRTSSPLHNKEAGRRPVWESMSTRHLLRVNIPSEGAKQGYFQENSRYVRKSALDPFFQAMYQTNIRNTHVGDLAFRNK